jgi:hypothetical protein
VRPINPLGINIHRSGLFFQLENDEAKFLPDEANFKASATARKLPSMASIEQRGSIASNIDSSLFCNQFATGYFAAARKRRAASRLDRKPRAARMRVR